MAYERGQMALNATHTIRFVRYTFIHVRCLDEDGNPMAGREYTLELPDGKMVEGALDDDGWAKEDRILPGDCVFTLKEPEEPQVRHLRMEFLDEDGDPMAGLPFEIKVGGQTISGVTSPAGRVEGEIEDQADDGQLTLWMDEDKSGESYTWPIKVSEHSS